MESESFLCVAIGASLSEGYGAGVSHGIKLGNRAVLRAR
jgi:hypothetical protein